MNFEQEMRQFAEQAKKEIASLAGETIAIQWVLTQVLAEMLRRDPKLADTFKTAFDRAANSVEDIAVKFGDSTHPAHLTKAIKIVEDLRKAVLE